MICPLCGKQSNQPLRSLEQNRFYWFYLSIIERETGNLAKSLHELYRRTLLPPKFLQVNGRELKIPTSTTELTKIEMTDYLDKISADSEVPIPDPHSLNDYYCGKKECIKCK